MKLYSETTNDRGSRPAKKGGDKWIEVGLFHRNNPVGRIILDDEGGNDWRLTYERPGGQSWIVDHCITPSAKSLQK